MMRTTRERLIEDTDRLRAWTDANLEDASRWSVEASYSPGSLAVLMLHDDQPDPTVAGPG